MRSWPLARSSFPFWRPRRAFPPPSRRRTLGTPSTISSCRISRGSSTAISRRKAGRASRISSGRPGRPKLGGKFKARLEFVIKNFWKENSKQPWNTDRGRTYLLNGAPASIDYDQRVDLASIATRPGQGLDVASSNEDVGANRAEVWIYPYDQYFIQYTFAFVQPSQWRRTQTTGSRYLGELETFNKTVTFGIVDEASYKQGLDGLAHKK